MRMMTQTIRKYPLARTHTYSFSDFRLSTKERRDSRNITHTTCHGISNLYEQGIKSLNK